MAWRIAWQYAWRCDAFVGPKGRLRKNLSLVQEQMVMQSSVTCLCKVQLAWTNWTELSSANAIMMI